MRAGTAYSKIPSLASGSSSAIANASNHGNNSSSSMVASTSLLISNTPPRGSTTSPRPPLSIKWAFLNVFQFCKFLRYVGHVMVLLVLALLGFSFFVLVVQVYGPGLLTGNVGKVLGSACAIVAFCLLTVMVLWSYFACVSTDPGRVPPGWHPFNDDHQATLELERMGYSDYYFDRRDPRRPRFCKRCQAWKPERAHHCSVTGRCVLRMDHYCIWVVNCVGLLNYKAFLLFLMYTCVSCGTAVALLIKPMIDFFTHSQGEGAPLAFLAVVIDSALCLSIAGFLIMHLQLISSNCTTIEMYEKDRLYPWPYNRGLRRNFEDTFGRNKLRWLLPLHTKEEKRALHESCLNQRLLSTPFASAASV